MSPDKNQVKRRVRGMTVLYSMTHSGTSSKQRKAKVRVVTKECYHAILARVAIWSELRTDPYPRSPWGNFMSAHTPRNLSTSEVKETGSKYFCTASPSLDRSRQSNTSSESER